MLQVANQYIGNVGTDYYQQQPIQVNDPTALQNLVLSGSTPPAQRALLQRIIDGQYNQFALALDRRNPAANNTEFNRYDAIVNSHINSLPTAAWFNNRSRTLVTNRTRQGSTSMQLAGGVLDWQAQDRYRTPDGDTFSTGSSSAESLCTQFAAARAAFQAWDAAKIASINSPQMFLLLNALRGPVTDRCPQYTGVPSYYSLNTAVARSFPINGLFTRAIGNTESLGASTAPTQNLAVLAEAEVYHERVSCDGPGGAGVGFANLPGGRRELPNLFNPFWQVRLTAP